MSEFFAPDVGNLTATALLGWYAWHTACHTIPALVEAFREELAAAREECAVEREALRSEIGAERGARHADHLAIVQALRELTESVRTPIAPRGAPTGPFTVTPHTPPGEQL